INAQQRCRFFQKPVCEHPLCRSVQPLIKKSSFGIKAQLQNPETRECIARTFVNGRSGLPSQVTYFNCTHHLLPIIWMNPGGRHAVVPTKIPCENARPLDGGLTKARPVLFVPLRSR